MGLKSEIPLRYLGVLLELIFSSIFRENKDNISESTYYVLNTSAVYFSIFSIFSIFFISCFWCWKCPLVLSLTEQFSAMSDGGMGKADFYFIFPHPLLWSIVCFESAGPACCTAELSESCSLAVRKWEINFECGTFKNDSAKIVWGTFLELLKGNYFFLWKTEKQAFWAWNIFISDFGVSWCLDLMRPWELFLFGQAMAKGSLFGACLFWAPWTLHSLCYVICHILTSLHMKNKWIFDKSVAKTLCFMIVL